MARPRNFDDEIIKIENKIDKCNNTLATLQEQKKSVLSQREQAELESLHNLIKQSGKSIGEFISQLNPSEEEVC